MMTRCFLDHIAVTSPTLEVGAAFVSDVLGVAPETGGEHPRMGTHNLLLRLGERLYLEIIAPNPAAPTPGRPRWFALDTLGAGSAPALAAWAACTADIRTAVSGASEPLGSIEPMSRGSIDWLITVPADGSLPLDGAGPALIEWQTEGHPADRLPDRGLSLDRLEILHPDPARVSRLLGSLALDGPVSVSAAPAGRARLVAHVRTPRGIRTLSEPGAPAADLSPPSPETGR